MTDQDETKRTAALQRLADATAAAEVARRELAHCMDQLLAVHGSRRIDRLDLAPYGDPRIAVVGACRQAADALDRELVRRRDAHTAVFGWCGPPSDSATLRLCPPPLREVHSREDARRHWFDGKAWIDERDGRIITCADSLTLWAEGVRTLVLEHGSPGRTVYGKHYDSVEVRLREVPEVLRAMEQALAGMAPVHVMLPPPTPESPRPEAAQNASTLEGGRIARLELD